MMGRLEQDQAQLFYSFCLEEVVPDDHQVRAIASVLDLSWVYGELSPHYPALGRPSIDPVLMIRMLILGYAFGLPMEAAKIVATLSQQALDTHIRPAQQPGDQDRARRFGEGHRRCLCR